MMIEKLNVLLAGHSAPIIKLLKDELNENVRCLFTKQVLSEADLRKALRSTPFDIILADNACKTCDVQTIFSAGRNQTPTVPIILIAETADTGTIVAGMKLGAIDFILQDELKRLIPAITAAITHGPNQQAREMQRPADLAERIRAGLFVFQDDKVLYVNEAAATLTGYSVPELLNRQLSRLIHPEHRKKLENLHVKPLKNKRNQDEGGHEDVVIITKNNMEKWVDFRANLIELGDGTAVLGTVFDITASKHVLESLLDSELRFRELFESSPDAIFVHDRDGNLLDVNPAACELHKMSYTELMSKNVSQLVPPEYAEGAQRYIERLFVEGSADLEGLSLTSGGQAVPVEIRAQRFKYRGRPALLFHVQDISYRKQLQASLLQAQKMEAIGSLAGGIAHDFNNLLTVILGSIEIAEEENTQTNNELKRIEEAALQGRGLVRQLLAFGRKEDFNLKVVNLNELIRAHTKLIKRLLGENIKLCTNFTATDLMAKVDQIQIHQVLTNLSINARDAMPNGGTLLLQTRQTRFDEQKANLYFVLENHDNPLYAEIVVSDTGTGMNQTVQDRIFEPFFTTKEADKGTGLGLSVVYGIIKQHTGEIRVKSAPGEGTSFQIYLPLAKPEKAKEKKAKVREPVSNYGSETIMVVEDEETVMNVTLRLLGGMGYRMLSAANGKEALNVFEKNLEKIDLVILDVVMPGMSGSEVYEKMCALRPELPVIFVSGYTFDSVTLPIARSTPNQIAVLSKPFTRDMLIKKVRKLLNPDNS